MDFLHQSLLLVKGQKGRSDSWSKERQAAFDRLDDFRSTKIQISKSPSEEIPSTLSAPDPLISTALQGLLRVSNWSSRSENAFFQANHLEDERDQRYYLRIIPLFVCIDTYLLFYFALGR